jgi:competence ComEA-like helix-hairpin-helix protein
MIHHASPQSLPAPSFDLGSSRISSSTAIRRKKKPPLHPINLNTATATELQQVPGIGPSTAAKILNMRKSHGPVKSVDDLRAIKGIGPQANGKNAQVFDDGKATRAKASAERARK